jgi:50S ribosomal protein L16 3-hydroxylase
MQPRRRRRLHDDSIGFRAPGTTELATAFLDFLRDELDLPGRYADPDLAPVRAPAAIGAAMQRQCLRMLETITWDRATAARFLGVFLTEPKPHVFLEPPRAPISRAAFTRRIAKFGVRVDRRVRLLYDPDRVNINGFAVRWPAAGAAALRRLANGRAIAPRDARGLSTEAATILYNWYRDGYVHSDAA